ncbi:MAG: hypothetical protein Q8S55_09885 [Methylococcaceae bacterium]|nr:hypothetical protein [Methylococcaceae bacterium]
MNERSRQVGAKPASSAAGYGYEERAKSEEQYCVGQAGGNR